MKRKDILERLNTLFEEKKQDMKKGKKKDEKKKGKEKPYVEDADADEKDDKKKMPQDKGAYKSLSSSGIADSTVAEENLSESMSSMKKKLFKVWFGKDHREIIRDAHNLSDKELKILYSDPEKSGGAQKLQMRAIEKEMKRRGLTEELDDEVLEESIDPKIKKEIDSMKKKRKDEITILMEIDKKYGRKLSKKDMEDIAAYLSED